VVRPANNYGTFRTRDERDAAERAAQDPEAPEVPPAPPIGPQRIAEEARPPVGGLVVLGVVAAAVYGGLVAYFMTWNDFDVWGALVVVPVLVAITLPLLLRLGARYGDSTLTLLLLAGLLLKFVAGVARWYVGAEIYGGSMDAAGYIGRGEDLAEQFRAGDFDVGWGTEEIGTLYQRRITGLIMMVIGPTYFGTWMVYAWMGYLGLLGWFAALATAVPGANLRRYAALLMFLPSMLYWPASVGKEAWMMLTLGLATYGAARLLTRQAGALPLLALGLLGASLVRPHMALLLVVATTLALALRRPSQRGLEALLGPIPKLVLVGLLAVASVVALVQVEEYFGVEDDPEQILDDTEDQTTTGGSSFEAARVRTPIDVPWAAVTVTMRPFPWEGHNLQARLLGLEGLLLAGLIAVSWRRLRAIPQLVRDTPWVALAVIYAGMFIVAFSTFGNFGIIARQRVQMLPFVLALLCLPLAARKIRERHDARNYT